MRERHLELDGEGPLYRQLILALRRQVANGTLAPGDLLPSTRQLAERLHIHRHTVAGAFQELVAEGWVSSEPGRGYRVCDKPLCLPYVADLPQDLEPEREPVARYRFPSGLPDLRLFPRDEYTSLTRRVWRDSDPQELLGYSSPQGRWSLRAQLRQFLSQTRSLECTSQQIVVTNGCQEAIYLIAQTLLQTAEPQRRHVAVEDKGFSPVWQALRYAGAHLQPVALDAQGIVPESLEELCRRSPPHLLYLTPVHQYPTTVTLPRSRRERIYELACSYDFLILEDDYDNEFHFASQPPPPMKADDPEGRILYCSTLSKLLAPSLRLGFAVLPTHYIESVKQLKQITSRQSDTLNQETVAAWMKEGGFERHLRRMRRYYGQRRSQMMRCLDEIGWSYQPSGGGMSLWVDFGQDSARLSLRAGEHGIEFRPGSAYAFVEGESSCCARLGYCQPNESEIQEGLQQLSRIAQSLARESETNSRVRPSLVESTPGESNRSSGGKSRRF